MPASTILILSVLLGTNPGSAAVLTAPVARVGETAKPALVHLPFTTTGPFFEEPAGTQSHVYFTADGIRDTKGLAWEEVGAVAETESGLFYPGSVLSDDVRYYAGPFTDANNYRLTNPNVWGPPAGIDFYVCALYRPFSVTSTPMFVSNAGAALNIAGWYLRETLATVQFGIYPGSTTATVSMASIDPRAFRLLCGGIDADGATEQKIIYQNGAFATPVPSKAGLYVQPTDGYARIGRLLANGYALDGELYEVILVYDTPTEAKLDAMYNRVMQQLSTSGQALAVDRDSVATMEDTNGKLVSSGFDSLRVEAARGALIESAATNSVVQSVALDQTPWVAYRAQVDPDSAMAPDGTVTADRVRITETGGSARARQEWTATKDRWTVSFWVRADTVASIAFGILQSSAWVAATPTVLSGSASFGGTPLQATGLSSTEWTHIAITTDAELAAGTASFSVYPRNSSTAQQVGDAVFVWGVQIESGVLPTSFTETTTAPVARLADAVSYPVRLNASTKNWCFGVGAANTFTRTAWGVKERNLLAIGAGAAANTARLYTLGSNLLCDVRDASNGLLQAVWSHDMGDDDQLTNVECCNREGNVELYADGVKVASATGTGTGIIGTYGDLFVGSNGAGAGHFDGFIQNVKVYEVAPQPLVLKTFEADRTGVWGVTAEDAAYLRCKGDDATSASWACTGSGAATFPATGTGSPTLADSYFYSDGYSADPIQAATLPGTLGYATTGPVLAGDSTVCVAFVPTKTGTYTNPLVMYEHADYAHFAMYEDGSNVVCTVSNGTSTLTVNLGAPLAGGVNVACCGYDWQLIGNSALRGHLNHAGAAEATGAVKTSWPTTSTFRLGTNKAGDFFQGDLIDVFVLPSESAVTSAAGLAEMVRHYFGQYTTGGELVTFDRNSSATIALGSRVHSIPQDIIRVSGDGFLVEPTRTNLVLQSAFASDWIIGTSTAWADSEATAPDGTAARKICQASGSAAYQLVTTSVAGYSRSVFFKPGTSRVIRVADAAAAHYATCNPDAMTVTVGGTGSSGLIEDVGGGWFRCKLTSADSTDSNLAGLYIANAGGTFTADGSCMHVWGYQLELGPYATSLIPTATAPVQRLTDVPLQTAIPIFGNEWCTTLEGTVGRAGWSGARIFTTHGTTDLAANSFGVTTANWFRVYDAAGDYKQVAYNGALLTSGTHTVTACNSSATLTIFVDGNSATGASSGTGTGLISTMPALLNAGSTIASSTTTPLGGSVKRVKFCRTSNAAVCQ